MQLDFHYYATYCAAILAGYSHEESLTIGYSSQFTDCCSQTLLQKLNAPKAAATTQLQLEMMEMPGDLLSLQEITRIWASFHFLPYDLEAEPGRGGRRYKNKYRLICNSNGPLVRNTVMLAKNASLQAAGIAMHVLADTWAHKYFAGTPSLVINNTNDDFADMTDPNHPRPMTFRHNPTQADDLENNCYTNTLYQGNENAIMNLGHGRAGHLPDYSFIKYAYMPAWGNYAKVLKDNPNDYLQAFAQMIYALKYLKGEAGTFELNTYDYEAIADIQETVNTILHKRQPDASAEWKNLGETLSGKVIEDFDIEKYQQEYIFAEDSEKDNTFLGNYFIAALLQKGMVTGKIYETGSTLAGFSSKSNNALDLAKDYQKFFERLKKHRIGGQKNE